MHSQREHATNTVLYFVHSSRTRSLRIEFQREHATNALLYFVHVPSSGTEIEFQREHATSNLLVWSVKFGFRGRSQIELDTSVGSRGRSQIELDTAPIRQVEFQREIPN